MLLLLVGLRINEVLSLASKDLLDLNIGSALFPDESRQNNVGSLLFNHPSGRVDFRNKDLDRGVIFGPYDLGGGAAFSREILLNYFIILVSDWGHLFGVEFFVY